MGLAYKNVYKLEKGALIQNNKNRIEYVDDKGKKRTKTNPTYEDFAKLGMYPKKESEPLEYDPETQEIETRIRLENNAWIVEHTVKEKEVIL